MINHKSLIISSMYVIFEQAHTMSCPTQPSPAQAAPVVYHPMAAPQSLPNAWQATWRRISGEWGKGFILDPSKLVFMLDIEYSHEYTFPICT